MLKKLGEGMTKAGNRQRPNFRLSALGSGVSIDLWASVRFRTIASAAVRAGRHPLEKALRRLVKAKDALGDQPDEQSDQRSEGASDANASQPLSAMVSHQFRVHGRLHMRMAAAIHSASRAQRDSEKARA